MIKLSGEGSLYRQLYDSLRNSIIEGAYSAGEKLPSSRELSILLGVSRNTVVSCYEQLNAEGYIETRFGSGSFVAENATQTHTKRNDQPKRQARFTETAEKSLVHWRNYDLKKELSNPLEVNFQYGPVDVDDVLLDDINRIMRRCRASLNSNYQPPEGLRKLRESIAHYAQQNRGCHCEADNVVITNGSQQALDLVARMLLQTGDQVIIEDPAYRGATQAFSNAGADLVRYEVDEKGINPTTFEEQQTKNCRLIYTTPSHQFPTGGILSLPRRLSLLEWANKHNVFIIEDDYDSEFRYKGPPIESIQGLDEFDQTIYIGTFSKVLSPVLRIGYVILPESLLDTFVALKWCGDRHSALLNQLILADFIDSPLFAKHLKRMRKKYSRRHDVLISSLKTHFGNDVRIEGTNAGIHLLAWLNKLDVKHEAAFLALARSKSLGLYTPTSLYQTSPKKLGLLLGYGNLSCDKIELGVERLAECYAEFKSQH